MDPPNRLVLHRRVLHPPTRGRRLHGRHRKKRQRQSLGGRIRMRVPRSPSPNILAFGNVGENVSSRCESNSSDIQGMR